MSILRILVVDDDQSMVRTLVDILALKGHQAAAAFSASEAIDQVRLMTFDLVVSDIKMPEMDGIELYRELRRIQPGLPLLLMTAYTVEDRIQQGLTEGAIDVLQKPLDLSHLLEFLDSLAESPTVVVVDDDPDFCQTLGDILQHQGYQVVSIIDPHTDVVSIVQEAQIVLLDMKLNEIGGYELLRRIRAHRADLPVLLVTGYQQEMSGAIDQSLELGARTCLSKPLDIPVLLRALDQLWLERLRNTVKKE